MGLKLNGTCQLLVYADNVNLPRDKRYTMKKNTKTLIDLSKEVGLEVNTEKNKHMLVSCHLNAAKIHERNSEQML
jgi:hypothetical protein